MIRFSTLRHALLSLGLLLAVGLFPSWALAAPAIVQPTSGNPPANAQSATITSAAPTLPASFATLPTAGNAVIVVQKAAGSGGSPHATAVTDNQGNTYTQIVLSDSSNSNSVAIWWSPSIGTPSGTFTVTVKYGSLNGTTSAIVELYEASGLAGTVDQFTSGDGGNIAVKTTTLTNTSANTNANDLVIGAIVTGNNEIVGSMGTPTTGYTTLLTTDSTDTFSEVSGAGSNTALKTVSAIETSAITWNWNVNGNGSNSFFDAVLVSFKGAAPPAPSNFPFFGVGD